MVHLIAEKRWDGENERQSFKKKTWATHSKKLFSIRGMDEQIFFIKAGSLKLANL